MESELAAEEEGYLASEAPEVFAVQTTPAALASHDPDCEMVLEAGRGHLALGFLNDVFEGFFQSILVIFSINFVLFHSFLVIVLHLDLWFACLRVPALSFLVHDWIHVGILKIHLSPGCLGPEADDLPHRLLHHPVVVWRLWFLWYKLLDYVIVIG
jgi:hypothetical protein